MITDCVDGKGSGHRRPRRGELAGRGRAVADRREVAGQRLPHGPRERRRRRHARRSTPPRTSTSTTRPSSRTRAATRSPPTSAAAASCPPAPRAARRPTSRSATAACTPTAWTSCSSAVRPPPPTRSRSYAKNSEGRQGDLPRPIRTKPQAALCTAHVFQQIPGQNRIFMGWYSQGTQVVDFEENANGTLDFKEAGYFIPANADQWVSHIFKVQRNANGSFTYFGAAGGLRPRRRRAQHRRGLQGDPAGPARAARQPVRPRRGLQAVHVPRPQGANSAASTSAACAWASPARARRAAPGRWATSASARASTATA